MAMAGNPEAVDPRLIAYLERAGDAGLDGAGFSDDTLAEVAPPAAFGVPAASATTPGDAPLPADIGAL